MLECQFTKFFEYMNTDKLVDAKNGVVRERHMRHCTVEADILLTERFALYQTSRTTLRMWAGHRLLVVVRYSCSHTTNTRYPSAL